MCASPSGKWLVLAACVLASGCGAASDELFWSSRDATTVVSWVCVVANAFCLAAAAWTLVRGARWVVFVAAPIAVLAVVVASAALVKEGRLAEAGDLTRRELPIALVGIGPFFWVCFAIVRRFTDAQRKLAGFVFAAIGVMHAFGFAVLAEKAILPAPHGAPIALLPCSAENAALFDDGTVWTWNAEHHAPRKVELPRAIDVSCGSALLASGEVQTWSPGDHRGHPNGVSGVLRLASADDRTCGLMRDGSVSCWIRGSPAERMPDVSDAVGLAVAETHACAVRRGGLVTCWGDYDETASTSALSGIVEVAVGEEFGCARTSTGILLCWGEGALGDGTTTKTTTPIGILPRAVAQVVAAGSHVCARMDDGTVLCWGHSEGGQVGTGATKLSPPEVALRPTRVELARPAVWIMTSSGHVCARSDRTFECWGWNGMDALRTGVHEHCDDDVGLFSTGTCTPTPHAVSFVE